MKATAFLFACGVIGLTGCAVSGGPLMSGTYDNQAGGGRSLAQQKKEYMRQRRGQSMGSLLGGGAMDAAAQSAPSDLFGAAARGDLRGVQDALAAGTSVDARNAAGATALLLASTNGSLPVIQTLLGAGADVNAADNNGRTPLAAATAGGYDDIARALKAAGARGPAASPAPGGADGQWWQKGGGAQ